MEYTYICSRSTCAYIEGKMRRALPNIQIFSDMKCLKFSYKQLQSRRRNATDRHYSTASRQGNSQETSLPAAPASTPRRHKVSNGKQIKTQNASHVCVAAMGPKKPAPLHTTMRAAADGAHRQSSATGHVPMSVCVFVC